MKSRFFSIIILFSILSFSILKAQSPFKAGVMVGVNFSQIDGDYQFGYDKAGVTFGLRGGFRMTKNLDLMTELLYIEKGAVPNSGLRFDARHATIKYQYAEVPLLLNYHVKKTESGIYQWTLYSGLSYGRLFRSISEVRKKGVVDSKITNTLSHELLNRHDLGLIIGLNYNIIPNLCLGVRHSISLNNVYTNLNPERNLNGSIIRESYLYFRNYYVSLQLQYDFIAPKIKQKKSKASKAPQRRASGV